MYPHSQVRVWEAGNKATYHQMYVINTTNRCPQQFVVIIALDSEATCIHVVMCTTVETWYMNTCDLFG